MEIKNLLELKLVKGLNMTQNLMRKILSKMEKQFSLLKRHERENR